MKIFNVKMMMKTAAALALIAAACGSAPVRQTQDERETALLSQAQRASTEALKTADRQRVLDWKDRGLGEDASPDWLLPAVRGNFSLFKSDWQITGDKVLKVGVACADRLNAAQTVADVQYAVRLASQLKQSVLSKAAISLQSDDQFAAVQDAAVKTKVDIAGQDRLTDFWQQLETTDSQGRKTRVYVYYVVYACDSDGWSKLVAKYLYDIAGNVPQQEAKRQIAGMFAEIDAETKGEQEKNEQVFREEVRAQLNALNAPRQSAAEQRAAYQSGDSAKIAAAGVTATDADYIAALAAIAGVE
ncbi:MAG: hypothetical protein LBJ86_02240 [Spirochaetaceae bacterium]|jgi:hypothetical protein|nr:hypothetical protein [Spirochaetaceae bacterium]